MGCDIHVYIERQLDSGKWIEVDASMGVTDSVYTNEKSWHIYRNYLLFGRLAGVRAFYIQPISDPKRLPNDISASVQSSWTNDWYLDGHSCSWLTAKELLDSQHEPIKFRTALNIKEYKKHLNDHTFLEKKHNEGFSFFDAIDRFDSKLSIISNQEMERMINLLSFLDDKKYMTYVLSDPPPDFKSNFDDLYLKILPRMLEIEPNPDKIRMVFWFDN